MDLSGQITLAHDPDYYLTRVIFILQLNSVQIFILHSRVQKGYPGIVWKVLKLN